MQLQAAANASTKPCPCIPRLHPLTAQQRRLRRQAGRLAGWQHLGQVHELQPGCRCERVCTLTNFACWLPQLALGTPCSLCRPAAQRFKQPACFNDSYQCCSYAAATASA